MKQRKTPATCLVCIIKATLKGKTAREKRKLSKELEERQVLDCPKYNIAIARNCAVVNNIFDDKVNAELPTY